MNTIISDPTITFHPDAISDCIYQGCCGLGRWCGAPVVEPEGVYCPDCRAKSNALAAQLDRLLNSRHVRLATCRACGDTSGAALCRACTETGEYCSCGKAATSFVAVGAHRQPVCDVCANTLRDLLPPTFPEPAPAWGCEQPWPEAA